MTVKIVYRPSALLALAGFFLTGASIANAQTANPPAPIMAQLTVRPLTRDDIAAYKLPSTSQVSAGLYTVAVGEPLYLEVQMNKAIPAAEITGVTWELMYKPPASKAQLAESPLGSDVPIYERADALTLQVAGRRLLRPDVTGPYEILATVKTANNGSATVAQSFIAGTYVGADTCAKCHGGMMPKNTATPWSQTAHATMFKNGINGVDGEYSSRCIACHTVGYDADPAAVNGGFDDVAAQLHWSFPSAAKEGTWDTVPDALKKVANIQCENCHGPGSVHVTGAFYVGISVSSDSGVCTQCHAAMSHHFKSAEWRNSVHAVATSSPSGAGREGCVGCHAGPGFIGQSKGAKTISTAYSPINCQTCHDPHGLTKPDGTAHLVRVAAVTLKDGTTVKDAGLGALCMNCHQSRQKGAEYAATAPASARFGPHHGPQADMLEGVNAFTYGKAIPSSGHGDVVEDTCVGCHMQAVDSKSPAFTLAGGHTFRMSYQDPQNATQPVVAVCQKCHGASITAFDFPLMDYDGDGRIDGIQTEVQRLLDKLSALLPPVGQPKSSLTIDGTWTRPQLEAAYNWQFVRDDGSRGIHNLAYTVGLLKASIADLTPGK